MELSYKEPSSGETQQVKFALIKFKNHHESVKYYHANRDLKLLYDKQIATLVQMRNAKEKTGDIPNELGNDVYTVL